MHDVIIFQGYVLVSVVGTHLGATSLGFLESSRFPMS